MLIFVLATMDAARKSELLAAYERQKGLNQGAPSGDKGGLGKRKGPPVRYPQPYSRDPNELFVQQTPTGLHKTLPAPMNNNKDGHIGNQPNAPVKYTNVRLAQQIGPHAKDTSFEVATVDYYGGVVKLYATEIDFFNQDPAFSDIWRIESKKRYNNQFYIREILEFLQRGHSLLDPQCRCIHKIDNDRAGELGIAMPRIKPGSSTAAEDRTSIRDGECQLSTARIPRSSKELALELAVGDLYEIRDKSGERLVDLMRRNPKIVTEEDESTDWWAFKATLGASSKQELLQLVRNEPTGLREPAEKDTYNGVQTDIDALVAQGDIYKLTNPETKASILFARRKDVELAVVSCWCLASAVHLSPGSMSLAVLSAMP